MRIITFPFRSIRQAIMEKFILRGHSSKGNSREAVFCLNLPKAKTFSPVAVKNCEIKTYSEQLISHAVMRRKKPISQYQKSHVRPYVIIDGVLQNLPKTLQQLLSAHPFPLSQGPITLRLDTNTETKETVADVVKAKRVFSHCDTQACSWWVPTPCDHQIKVPYLFDPSTDLHTMVTEKMTEYRFAYGYAGIPSDCKHCSADVLEHQVLHLVHHQLCRFCRFESRPLEQFKGGKSLKRFKKAEQILNWRDNKTCSICLKESKDKYAREKHEAIVHKQECQKFKCDICPKSFVCQSSLDYHVKKHQQQVRSPLVNSVANSLHLQDL